MSETGRIEITALSIGGKAGSGRSSLMRELASALERDGISTALVFQEEGTPAENPGESVSVAHLRSGQLSIRMKAESLQTAVRILASSNDIVLVQGEEDTPFPMLWLDHPGDSVDSVTSDRILERFAPGAGRLPSTLALVRNWLMDAWLKRPVMVAIHRAASTSESQDPALLHHVALLTNLTNRDDTLLLEFPAGEETAGGETLLRTLRSRPGSAWLLAGTDAELPDATSMRALFEARQPGRWAVGFSSEKNSPLPMLLEPQAVAYLEDAHAELAALRDHERFYALSPESSDRNESRAGANE